MKHSIKSLEDIFHVSNSYQISKLLLAAVQLDIFTSIGKACKSAGALAKILKVDKRALEIVLNALSAAGFLLKKAGGYANTVLSGRYLSADSHKNKINIIKHHNNCIEPWLCLEDTITTGTSVYASSNPKREEIEIIDFIKGMHNIASELVPVVLKSLKFINPPKKILDLGCGPATYSIAFARKFPASKVVGFDMKIPAKVAREYVKRAGVKNILLAEGDFFINDLGSGYDFVWLSQIIHSSDEKSILKLFKKIRKSMIKGGKLVVHEFLLDENKTSPYEAAMFAVHMLAVTKGGRSYSGGEISSLLKEAGFSKIRVKRKVTKTTGFVEASA